MRGGPLGRSLASPRPAPSSPGRTASPPPSGSHVRSAGASTLQAVACPSVLSGCVLRLGRRPPLASRPGPVLTQRRTFARIRHNARLRKRRPSSPPVFGRGGASGAQASGPHPRPGSRLGAAHLRTGGEEECTGTADTNPGCNYLVRGYSPSMHYFWRGDMPHFSPPLPFQRGRAECRRVLARDLGGPDQGRPGVPGCGSPPIPAAAASSTSAGLSGAPAGARQWWSPDPRGRCVGDLGWPERGARGCRAVVVPRPLQPARR